MKKILLFICIFINIQIIAQTKCKFIGYNIREKDDYSIKEYCGSRHHRNITYGTEKTTTASFYDYKLKRMFYIQKSEQKRNYCHVFGYYSNNWEHKGFKNN